MFTTRSRPSFNQLWINLEKGPTVVRIVHYDRGRLCTWTILYHFYVLDPTFTIHDISPRIGPKAGGRHSRWSYPFSTKSTRSEISYTRFASLHYQEKILQHGTTVIAWKLHITGVLQARYSDLFQSSIPGQLFWPATALLWEKGTSLHLQATSQVLVEK